MGWIRIWSYVARVRTLTTLRRVDGSRKGIILRFLKEAELIAGGESDIISLYWADLTDAYLHGADLRDLNLKRVDFFNADLSMADMRKTDLREAQISANLQGTDLGRG